MISLGRLSRILHPRSDLHRLDATGNDEDEYAEEAKQEVFEHEEIFDGIEQRFDRLDLAHRALNSIKAVAWQSSIVHTSLATLKSMLVTMLTMAIVLTTQDSHSSGGRVSWSSQDCRQ